ncbi:hypothetical protein J8F10_35450 [Gemmata sp. G18]|uniref:Secreted protein n=1 Tax=Gemmata palustris TaxID=2822762 RepID=A0ABS5C3L9_9BACT|nr:hypothetical protein [Gemmata palustris]MBP3960551.1 hypothetical protein [Gemmata palustris]
MLRRALMYCLIFAVAVGPLLCCCSAGKASAFSQSTAWPDRVSVESPSSCCAHKQIPTTPDHTKKSAPQKPTTPSEKCPCKDGSSQSQTVQTESASGDVTTFLRLLALDADPLFDALTAGEVAALLPETSRERCGTDHSRLTTADLLYAHHNLRC